MVIDAAKGIEAQTRKLFEVCRLRDMPIITFINKMDREAKDPIELLDEIASTLALDVAPMTWPHRLGPGLQGHLRPRQQPHAGVRLQPTAAASARSIENYAIDDAQARRRGRAGARRLSGLRPRVLSRRPSDAGVLRQRLQQFRRPRAAGRAGRLGAAAAPAAGRAARHRADRAQGRGLRLQGPGQHGPQPPRPHRLPAAVLRQVPPRHEADADGHRQDAVGQLADPVLRPRARDRRRGLAGRHHRHSQPRRAARRRHADRGRDDQDRRHPQLRAGDPAPRAAGRPDEVQAAASARWRIWPRRA